MAEAFREGVVVIPGSSNPDYIQENTELFDFALTDDKMARINALDRGEKHDWYLSSIRDSQHRRKIPYEGEMPTPDEWLKYAVEQLRNNGLKKIL